MIYLQGEESKEADKCTGEAIKEALKSRCEKSKRGVVIVKEGEIIGRGCNNPPLEMRCQPEVCYGICAQYCVHAEQNAIMNALREGFELIGSRAYHIRIKNGEVTSSGEPSCIGCSKLVLQSGISEFVLKHSEGYGLYESKEFHEISLRNLRKNS